MADRVKWTQIGPHVWTGSVSGCDAYYQVFDLGTSAWLTRRGTSSGIRMTHVGRAMDMAELQEQYSARQLREYGLPMLPLV
jgi:hypothetical protein